MYKKIKAEIASLSNLISETREKAAHFNRQLTAKEAGLLAEAEIKINELRMELPANESMKAIRLVDRFCCRGTADSTRPRSAVGTAITR